jgi:hypothetical protein
MRTSLFLAEGKREKILLGQRRFDIAMYRGVTIDGLVNGFIDRLYMPLETTSNYSATANLLISQIITAPAKPFPARYIFNRSLATASNSGDSSASRAQVLSSQTPMQD